MNTQIHKLMHPFKILKKASMLASFAALMPIAANAQTYCMSTLNCGSSDYVNMFSTTGGTTNITNNNSGCSTGGYVYNSTMKHTATLGATVGFTIGPGPWSSYMAIYVDWNQNGSFSDPGEQVWTSGTVTKINASATATGTFTVPSSATPGITRMRAVGLWSTNPNVPCGLNGDLGESEDYNFEVISPCSTVPVGLAVSNITSISARFTWSQPTPTLYNEYALTTSATPPNTGASTTAMQYNATALTPNTQYYFHVRNQCNSTDKTVWITVAFKTNPPCTPPPGYRVQDLSVESANVFWRKIPHALGYEYVLDLKRTNPLSSTPMTQTTDTSFYADQLAEGTTYYVHIRTLCPGGEYSDWMLDSFTTLILCRPPQLMVDYVNSNRAVVYWDPVRTAVEYEYEVSQSPTPLGKGTRILTTSFLAFPLKDGNTYYFHVRSNCIDQNRPTSSEWTTTAFRTWPTSTGNITKEDFTMSVFPNPVKNTLTVQLNGTTEKGTIVITDVAGQVVYTSQVNIASLDINMANMAPGVYFVKYADGVHVNVLKVNKL